jgi:hypothetical protein
MFAPVSSYVVRATSVVMRAPALDILTTQLGLWHSPIDD